MQILIAEDDNTSRKILAAILKKWGYDTIETCDGIGALEELKKPQAPNIVLLDWNMPGMDGLEVCRKVRQLDSSEPRYIILLTARGDSEDIIQGLEGGADDYIAKPFNSEELRARINVGCRIVGLQIELARKEKLQGVLEMARTVCHEINQPLHVLSGLSDLLLLQVDKDDPRYTMMTKIKSQVFRIGELTKKIMRMTSYQVKDYMDGRSKIIDIEKSSTVDEHSFCVLLNFKGG